MKSATGIGERLRVDHILYEMVAVAANYQHYNNLKLQCMCIRNCIRSSRNWIVEVPFFQ